MERQDSGDLSLDAIMREVREALDGSSNAATNVAPDQADGAWKGAARRIVEAITGRFRQGA